MTEIKPTTNRKQSIPKRSVPRITQKGVDFVDFPVPIDPGTIVRTLTVPLCHNEGTRAIFSRDNCNPIISLTVRMASVHTLRCKLDTFEIYEIMKRLKTWISLIGLIMYRISIGNI